MDWDDEERVLAPLSALELTEREEIVVTERAAGKTYKAIAQALGITPARASAIARKAHAKLQAQTPSHQAATA